MADVKLSDLRCRVQIKRRVSTPDGIGGSTSTWATVTTVWAKVDATRVSEGYRAERTEALVSQSITIRSGTNVLADDVAVFDGHAMTVKAVRPVTYGKAQYVELLCAEGDPAGGKPV